MKSTNHIRKGITILFLLLPVAVIAAQNIQAPEHVFYTNQHITEMLGQLSPMAISPFFTLFITCLFTKLSFSNDFIATHPIYDNWFVLLGSFMLFMITLLPKLFSKLAGPIPIMANYLENKAGMLISVLIVLLPIFAPASDKVASYFAAGFFTDYATLYILFLSVVTLGYLMVIMSVRLFLEILIFLSPIPFVDTVFEFLKLGLTAAMVLLGIFFPTVAFIFSSFIFLISLAVYRKSRSTIRRIRYLLLQPVFDTLFSKPISAVDTSLPAAVAHRYADIRLAIPVFTNRKSGRIPKNREAWLIKAQQGVFLVRTAGLNRLQSFRIESSCDLNLHDHFAYLVITHPDNSLHLSVNKSYRKLKEQLAESLECDRKDSQTGRVHQRSGKSGEKGNLLHISSV